MVRGNPLLQSREAAQRALMICKTSSVSNTRELVTFFFFFAFSEFESFIEYFESWALSGGFYVSASRMADEALGSILLHDCLA